MTLAGKRVLITGGGSGAGADLARGFAEAGAEVVISGRREEPLRAVAEPLRARWVQADVTDEDSVARMFREAGACDIVIANAGAADSAVLARTTLAQWNAMIAVNLTGVFLTFREALGQFRGEGRLIAVASTAGLKGYAKVAPYAAAKHGVVGLVRSLSLEVARKGITVNAICPGYTETDMVRAEPHDVLETSILSQIPVGRLGQPEEIARCVLFLASERAGFITGSTLTVNGGQYLP
jgi:NAD(P)-dependent dehydrogenase (short-subunit alcohol dehydrogenase family)